MAPYATLLVLPGAGLAGPATGPPAEDAAGAPGGWAEVAAIVGLPEADLRSRLGAGHPCVLARSRDRAALVARRDRLRALGHRAAVVADDEVRGASYPLACRAVRLGRERIEFLDARGATLAALPRGAAALLVVANLEAAEEAPGLLASGTTRGDATRSVSEARRAERTRCLDRLLSTEVAGIVLDVSWAGGPGRVRIASRRFRFASLGERAAPGVSQNMKALVREIARVAGRARIDVDHGRVALPVSVGIGARIGATIGGGARGGAGAGAGAAAAPADRPLDAAERAFEGYCRWVHLAWREGLFLGDDEGEAGGATTEASGETMDEASLPHEGAVPAAGAASLRDNAPPDDRSRVDRTLDRVRAWGPPGAVLALAALGLGGLLSTIAASASGGGAGERPGAGLPLVLLSIGALLLLHALALFARKRRIENVPTSRIRSAAAGLCEVVGRARAKHPLRTPFSLMPCVYYEYRLVTREQTGAPRASAAHAWRRGGRTPRLALAVGHEEAAARSRIEAGSSGDIPFLVEDDTGAVEVDPRGAIVSVSTGQTLHALPFAAPALPGTLVVAHETYIPVGYPLHVMGELREVAPDPARDRAERAALYRRLKEDPAGLAAWDADRDGAIDETEWSAARDAVDAIWRAGRAGPDGRATRVVIGRPSNGDPFTISDRTEPHVVRGLARRMWASLAAGVPLTLAAGLWLARST